MLLLGGGYTADRCDGAECKRQGEMEKDVLLWRPLMGAAERKRKRRSWIYGPMYEDSNAL